MTRLPEPFLPLHDSDFKKLAKLDLFGVGTAIPIPGLSVFAKAGNRMGTARRCNLARLFFTLQQHWQWELSNTIYIELAQILIRVSESIITSLTRLNLPTQSTDLHTRLLVVDHLTCAIYYAHSLIRLSSGNPFPLILPDDYIGELERAGFVTGLASTSHLRGG